MSREVEMLFSELFEAAGVGRRWGEHLTAAEGQTQSRWQTLWTASAGSFTVPQIARRLGVTRQNVQRVVTDLADEDLVTLAANPDHKSSPIVALTPTGTQTLRRINDAAHDSHLKLLETFPEPDVETLRTLLQQFTTTLKTLGAEQSTHQ